MTHTCQRCRGLVFPARNHDCVVSLLGRLREITTDRDNARDAEKRLTARLAAAEAERDREKERRIHWQGLAYTGMRVVDAVLNNQIQLGEGTTEESMQINSRMAIDKMNHLRSEWAAKATLTNNHCERCGGLLICIDDSVCSCNLATISASTFPMIADGCFTGDTLTLKIDDSDEAANAEGRDDTARDI